MRGHTESVNDMRRAEEETIEADRYFALARMFPLRPIRSEDALDRAIAMVDSLLDRESLSAAESDYLEVLSDIVRRYESEEHPLPSVSDAELVRHLIEARAITQAQLAAETAIAESTISAVLSGKRMLSRKHVATLARYFKVNPAVFIAT